MKKDSSNKKFGDKPIELNFRVLCYEVDSKTWAAHCLETDLVGYGETFDQALKELKELIDIQIGFAAYKNQPALLDRPAPANIVELYNNLFRSCLQQFTIDAPVDKKRRVTSIPWPSRWRDSDFSVAQA